MSLNARSKTAITPSTANSQPYNMMNQNALTPPTAEATAATARFQPLRPADAVRAVSQ
jgi:hypothetical protein